jgi:flavorubredoxin
MQTLISEIAEDTYRITLRPAGSFISFNHFLIRDTAPTLIHTGHNKTFDVLLEQVATLISPGTLRYICFSHYEADECGSLNKWLETAPSAEVCVNKICDSNLKDFAIRPSRLLKDNDSLDLGTHQLRFVETPHFPHAWEAALFMDTKTKVLFSSDIGTQQGFPQLKDNAVDIEDIVKIQDRLHYMPYGLHLSAGIKRLIKLDFNTMATMHGNCLDRIQSIELFRLLEENNRDHNEASIGRSPQQASDVLAR